MRQRRLSKKVKGQLGLPYGNAQKAQQPTKPTKIEPKKSVKARAARKRLPIEVQRQIKSEARRLADHAYAVIMNEAQRFHNEQHRQSLRNEFGPAIRKLKNNRMSTAAAQGIISMAIALFEEHGINYRPPKVK